MENQARLLEGLGIPWYKMHKMHPNMPQTVVFTNLARDPAYLEVVYDYNQILPIPFGRSFLCLCDQLLRQQLVSRKGELSDNRGLDFERPYWDHEPNFAFIETDIGENRHVLIIDKNHLPSLKEYVTASLAENVVENLRKSEYAFLVEEQKTQNLEFVFHMMDMSYKTFQMHDMFSSCNCHYSQNRDVQYHNCQIM